jgi:hypothetical protein
MHGITRTRSVERGSEPRYTKVRRIVVRYVNGRTVAFVPESGREDFSEDDMLELAKVFTRASSAVEWAKFGDTTGG